MIHLLWLNFPGISQNSWLLHTVRSWVPGRGMIYFFTQSQPNWQQPTGQNVRLWRLLKTLSSSRPRFSVLFCWPWECIPILCRTSASSVTARVWADTANYVQLERAPAYKHSNGALLGLGGDSSVPRGTIDYRLKAVVSVASGKGATPEGWGTW